MQNSGFQICGLCELLLVEGFTGVPETAKLCPKSTMPTFWKPSKSHVKIFSQLDAGTQSLVKFFVDSHGIKSVGLYHSGWVPADIDRSGGISGL